MCIWIWIDVDLLFCTGHQKISDNMQNVAKNELGKQMLIMPFFTL